MTEHPLIQVEELKKLLAGPESGHPVILDVRFRMGSSSGRQEFESAHLPGASYVDMDTELAAIRPDGVGGRHPMPSAESFATAMRCAGVTMSRPVVGYDDWGSVSASRLWWMLRHFGFLDVRVLDGGMAAWTAAGEATESRAGAAIVGDFSVAGGGIGRVLSATDAVTYAASHRLLDARPAERFRGQNETVDPVPGHIPGAVGVPALATLDATGRFLPVDELAALLRRFGEMDPSGTAGTETVGTYCGSGIQPPTWPWP